MPGYATRTLGALLLIAATVVNATLVCFAACGERVVTAEAAREFSGCHTTASSSSGTSTVLRGNDGCTSQHDVRVLGVVPDRVVKAALHGALPVNIATTLRLRAGNSRLAPTPQALDTGPPPTLLPLRI